MARFSSGLIKKLSFLFGTAGLSSSAPALMGSASKNSTNYNKENLGNLDHAKKFGPGGCHYYVDESQVKKWLGGINEDLIENFLWTLGGGNNKYGVVYDFGIAGDHCQVGQKIATTDIGKKSKYLMGMTEEKLINAYRKQDRDTLILYHRRDINWEAKWKLGKRGGGECENGNGNRLCWPQHVIMCLKTKTKDGVNDLNHKVVDARYDLKDKKCGYWDGKKMSGKQEWPLYKQNFYSILWEQLTWLLVNEK